MKQKIIVLLCLLLGSSAHGQELRQDDIGHRGIIDMSLIFSYDNAEVKCFEGFELAELSVGEIDLQGKVINSQLVYINRSELANLKSLPRVIFADYLAVKVLNGRFAVADESDIKKGEAIRLVFNYGKQLPIPKKNIQISGVEDKRTLGVFDLEYTIFYEMKFLKPGTDFGIYQTAMTVYDSTVQSNITRSKQLVAFLNESDANKLKKGTINAAIVESVPSVWSNQIDKWVKLKESTWSNDKTKKYTIDLAWNADINTAKIDLKSQKDEDQSDADRKDSGASKNQSNMGITPTDIGRDNITVKIDHVTGAKSYVLQLASDEAMKNVLDKKILQSQLKMNMSGQNGAKILPNTTYYLQYTAYKEQEGNGEIIDVSKVVAIKSKK